MKTMKKIFSMLLLVVFAVALMSCGGKDNNKKDDPTPEPTPSTELDKALDAKWEGNLKDRKVYLTTCGQADSGVIASILLNCGIGDTAYTSKDLLTAKEVSDAIEGTEVPAVLLVIGASSKGLGAAGVDVDDEVARAEAFVALADSGKIELIVMHVGGSARRGATSDPIIKVATPAADLLLVVNTGNSDGYFTTTATANSIELYLYKKNSGLLAAFKTLFGVAA